jgi:hypothetical protein
MPIPFQENDDMAQLGALAYLTVRSLEEGNGFEGALFLINARGEPLEFTYNRVETPHSFLWRKGDMRRHAQNRLTTSLLSICPVVPKLLLALARETESVLFCKDIRVSLPVCRIALTSEIVSFMEGEVTETMEMADPLNLFWFPALPPEDSVARRLLAELATRGLLLEPFERAKRGLDEVYKKVARGSELAQE